MKTTYTKSTIAKMFHVSEREVTRWLADGLPHSQTGKSFNISVYDTNAFLVERSKRKILMGDDGEMLDLNFEKAKLTREQTISQKYKNDLTEKTIIKKEEVTDLIKTCIVQNKQYITSLPALISNRLSLNSDQENTIESIINKMLTNFSTEVAPHDCE